MSAGRTTNTSSQEWNTPPKYINAIKNFFDGTIDLDPCSNMFSLVGADHEYKLPEQDGLLESWNFSKIYVNPPYGSDYNRKTKIKNWLCKCAESHKIFKSEVIALVPVATNTSHWKHYIFGRATAITFLYDTRLKFLINGKDMGKGAPMACAIIYWGQQYEKFFDIFITYGAVVDIQNLKNESYS